MEYPKMNGINPGKVGKDDFLAQSHEERDWLTFKALEETQQILACRPAVCGKKFAPRWWGYIGIGAVLLLLILIGVAFEHPETSAKVANKILDVTPINPN
jgi:hypothetical protein